MTLRPLCQRCLEVDCACDELDACAVWGDAKFDPFADGISNLERDPELSMRFEKTDEIRRPRNGDWALWPDDCQTAPIYVCRVYKQALAEWQRVGLTKYTHWNTEDSSPHDKWNCDVLVLRCKV